MLTTILGVLVVTAVFVDVLLTVFDSSGRSLFSRHLYRAEWTVWRSVMAFSPQALRQGLLSSAAPLMIFSTLAFWLALLIAGFACLYVDGPFDAALLLGEGTGTDWAASFRLSVVTISTIGFVEVGRASEGYAVVVAFQAVLGSLIMTLAATYFLSVNQAVNRRQAFFNRLSRSVNDPSVHICCNAVAMIEAEIDQIIEGMRRYPIGYYARPADAALSLPRFFEVAETVTGHARGIVPNPPALSSARSGLSDLASILTDRFAGRDEDAPIEPAVLADHLYVDLGYDDDGPAAANRWLRALSAPPKAAPRPLRPSNAVSA